MSELADRIRGLVATYETLATQRVALSASRDYERDDTLPNPFDDAECRQWLAGYDYAQQFALPAPGTPQAGLEVRRALLCQDGSLWSESNDRETEQYFFDMHDAGTVHIVTVFFTPPTGNARTDNS